MREGSPAEASKGPLVVITAIRVLLLSLLCVLLVLVSSLGLGTVSYTHLVAKTAGSSIKNN